MFFYKVEKFALSGVFSIARDKFGVPVVLKIFYSKTVFSK